MFYKNRMFDKTNTKINNSLKLTRKYLVSDKFVEDYHMILLV